MHQASFDPPECNHSHSSRRPDKSELDSDVLVVGIGASAGGLHALESLFTAMPLGTGFAFVVIQHLSPHYPSHMDELMARKTRLTIRRVEDGDAIAPNTLFLLPPKKEMSLSKGRLWLTEKDDRALSLPIDRFLASLAEEKKSRAVAVILSGTGSDGTEGCRRIREAGGLVICQSEATAEFPTMPQNVENSGLSDLSLAPHEIPEALERYSREFGRLRPAQRGSPEENAAVSDIDTLFSFLKAEYNIDFRHYKTGTFSRRVQRRLLLTGCASVENYVRRLQNDKGRPTPFTAICW